MLQKFRIFKGRFLGMGIAVLALGTQITFLIEHWLNQEDITGNLATIGVFLAYFLLQLFSQNIENQRQTSTEEFKSGSIIKINYLSKAMQIIQLRLWIMLGASLVLGMQIAQIYLNWLNDESILFALLGTLAMTSLIVIQIIAQSNENRKTTPI